MLILKSGEMSVFVNAVIKDAGNNASRMSLLEINMLDGKKLFNETDMETSYC